MADEEFDVDGKALSSLRVVDLKQELEKRCLSKSGSKKDLVERLKTQLELERLHESAPDEGHVPNLKLQDEIAEPNDVIKEYLAKQQKIFAIQKEARRRVELEERQVIEGSEASAGDTSQEEEEQEQSRLQKEADITEPSSSFINAISSASTSGTDQPQSRECVSDVSAQFTDKTESPLVKESALEERDDENEGCGDSIVKEPMQIESTEEMQEVSRDFEAPDKEAVVEAVSFDHSVSPEGPVGQLPSSDLMVGVEEIATLAEHGRRSPEPLERKSSETIESDSAECPEQNKRETESMAQDPDKSDDHSEDVAGSSHIDIAPLKEIEASQSDSETKHVKKAEKSMSSSPSPPSEVTTLPPQLLVSSIADGPDMLKKEDVIAEDKKRVSNTDEDGQDYEETAAEDGEKNGVESRVAGSNGDDDDGKNRGDGLVNRASSSPSSDDGGGLVSRGRKEVRQRQRSHRDRRRSSSSSSSQDMSSGSSSSGSRQSRSRSSSSGSSADSRGSNRHLSKSGPSSTKLPDTKEIYVGNSSPPSREVVTVKDDADDSVAIMDTEDDLDTFPPADAATSAVAATVAQSLPVLVDSKVMTVVDAQKPEQKVEVAVKLTPGEQPRIQARKISLSTSKERSSIDGSGDGSQEKPLKRRRWGGGSAASSVISKRPSVSISTDSLKGLIPSVKEALPILGLLENDPKEQRPAVVDKLPVADNTRRAENETGSSKREKIVFDSPSTELSKDETAPDKPVKEDGRGKVVLLRMAPVRSAPVSGLPVTAAATAASTERRSSPSPARNPPSCIVHIRNLVRPFTLGQLKELLGQTGQLVDPGFWIDKIKSKCYVTYSMEDQAIATRRTLHGTQWPSSNPKRLVVDFATQDELDFHRMLTDPQAVPPKPVVVTGNTDKNQVKPVRGVAPAPEAVSKPMSERDRRRSAREDREAESTKRSNKEKRETTRGSGVGSGMGASGGRMPVREWDRDKIGERSPGERARSGGRQRGRASSRSRSPMARQPLKERDRHVQSGNDVTLRDRRDRRERRREVVEEEAPAKLLDDLFRKTKTTPCIYWLPLTSEQIRSREEQRKQRQVDREKRWREQQTIGSASTGGTTATVAAAPTGDHNSNVSNSKRNDRENRDSSRNRRQSDSTGHSRYKRR